MSPNSFLPLVIGSVILAVCSVLPAQATDRQDSRELRQEVRPEVRDVKQDCRENDQKDNYECRQDKREVKIGRAHV